MQERVVVWRRKWFSVASESTSSSSFDILMAQPALREAEKKMAARVAHRERAVKSHARAAKRASKSQLNFFVLPAGGASLDGATFEAALAATNVGIRALVEVKDLFLSACRVPEQGSGRGGFGAVNLTLGEKDIAWLSDLPELLANLARSAADLEGSVSGVDKSLGRSGKARQSAHPLQRRRDGA
jgi:hypothetical protein